MTTASRLARLEVARLALALRDFRSTLDAFDAAQEAALGRQSPAERAALEVQEDDAPPDVRDHLTRLGEAVPVLHNPYATPAEVRRAIAQLEPLVVPRGSPDYVIVGAIRRVFAGWLAAWELEGAGTGKEGHSDERG